MLHTNQRSKTIQRVAAFAVTLFCCPMAIGQQSTLLLTNGMALGPGQLSEMGKLDPQGSVGSNTGPGGTSILRMDDGLRYTFVNHTRALQPGRAEALFKIDFANKFDVCDGGGGTTIIEGVGPVFDQTPFDIFGRRRYTVPNGTGKTASIVQGITEVSPNYVRIQGLRAKPIGYIWDQRIALSSIPKEVLREILIKNANPNNAQEWLDIVTLYWNSSRYVEAREMLVKSINRFPELEGNRGMLKELDQLIADQMFQAVGTAKDAGQFKLAETMLKSFDTSMLADETRLKVLQQIEQFSKNAKQREDLINGINEDIQKLNDPAAANELAPIVEEIRMHLTDDGLLRFADYLRLRSDPTLKPDQRVALGIGGWLYGSGLAESNLAIVRSGYAARKLIRDYLSGPVTNEQIIQELSKLESGTPRFIARILANMPPPLPVPDGAAVTAVFPTAENPNETVTEIIPGRYQIEVPLSGPMRGKTVRYIVQLPPEYSPYRRYPCVVTLPSEISSPEDQIEWWTSLDRNSPERRCIGEAAKHGYIVVSPAWAQEKQPLYNFTENEHRLVLTPIRDAMRRFSIDTDRLFLSGHFMGGDAAWDIAWAHPDMWAGAIVIGGLASKFIVQYWPNAQYVPMYFVTGEIDGKPAPIAVNAKTWDNILDRKQIDAMVTMYRGRGHDHFQEELPRIVTWMNLPVHKRNFARTEFKATTCRAGDRFFWWFETDQLEPNKLVHPLLFEPGQEYEIESSINKETNTIQMTKFAAKRYSLWLSPEFVDFGRKLTVAQKGNNAKVDLQGSTRVMLEDVYFRADRQHPFWQRIDLPLSR